MRQGIEKQNSTVKIQLWSDSATSVLSRSVPEGAGKKHDIPFRIANMRNETWKRHLPAMKLECYPLYRDERGHDEMSVLTVCLVQRCSCRRKKNHGKILALCVCWCCSEDSLCWHRPAVYLLSLKCYINRRTQPYRSNILVLYFSAAACFGCLHQPSSGGPLPFVFFCEPMPTSCWLM